MRVEILTPLALLTLAGCATLPTTNAVGSPASVAPLEQKRPNIIFIMSDDHAQTAISAYGTEIGKIAPTPNIDRIAKNGALFENSYVTNSLCGPSRATMLTGLFSHLHGFTRNGQKFDNAAWNWVRELGNSGYQTALFGKWHLNYSPEGSGIQNWAVLDDQGKYYNPDIITANGKKVVEGYATDITTDLTIDWLTKQRKADQPFVLMMHHKAPHRNFMPAIRHIQKYIETEFPVPTNYFDHYDGRPAAEAQEMTIARDMYEGHDLKMTKAEGSRELRFNPWTDDFNRMTPAQREAYFGALQPGNDAMNRANLDEREMAIWKYQRYMDEYLGTVAAVDESVGRVLDWLEASGEMDNTIVVYTSDQGFYLGEHGWFDKRFMYEESLRTPFLMQYPGHIAPGTRVKAPIQNIDYAATFLDYAGLPPRAEVQGRSIRAVADGAPPADWRDAVYYHYYEYVRGPGNHAVSAHYGIKSDRYKLIRFYGHVNAWEFYDLASDPNEMRNRIEDPAMQDKIAGMKRRLAALRLQYRDDGGPAVAEALASPAAIARGQRDAEAAAGLHHH
ncbi:MAG: sulfatase [Tsuneonella sp.]